MYGILRPFPPVIQFMILTLILLAFADSEISDFIKSRATNNSLSVTLFFFFIQRAEFNVDRASRHKLRETRFFASISRRKELERKKKDDPAPRIPRDSRENRSKRDLDSVNPCHQFVVRAFFDPVNPFVYPFVSHTRATNSTSSISSFPSISFGYH